MSTKNNWKDILIALVFILFAILQYNDSDSLLWIFTYSAVAIIALTYRKIPTLILNALLIVAMFGLFIYTPSLMQWFKDGMPSVVESMKAASPYIELVREAGGLIIIVIVLIYYRIKSKNLYQKSNLE